MNSFTCENDPPIAVTMPCASLPLVALTNAIGTDLTSTTSADKPVRSTFGSFSASALRLTSPFSKSGDHRSKNSAEVARHGVPAQVGVEGPGGLGGRPLRLQRHGRIRRSLAGELEPVAHERVRLALDDLLAARYPTVLGSPTHEIFAPTPARGRCSCRWPSGPSRPRDHSLNRLKLLTSVKTVEGGAPIVALPLDVDAARQQEAGHDQHSQQHQDDDRDLLEHLDLASAVRVGFYRTPAARPPRGPSPRQASPRRGGHRHRRDRSPRPRWRTPRPDPRNRGRSSSTAAGAQARRGRGARRYVWRRASLPAQPAAARRTPPGATRRAARRAPAPAQRRLRRTPHPTRPPHRPAASGTARHRRVDPVDTREAGETRGDRRPAGCGEARGDDPCRADGREEHGPGDHLSTQHERRQFSTARHARSGRQGAAC